MANRIKGIAVEIGGDTTKPGFKQREKLAVDYFDTETLEVKLAEMFMEG